MAGSIGLSLTQRYDKTSHEPLDGGLLRFYAAGTTTPQNAYQDISLTIPWENPMTLDSGGNVPQLFFEDGYIKFTLTNSAGVTQISADYVLVLGPTSGSGAAPSVDATTIFSAGDLKVRYGTGAHTGWVRANGRTIGSLSSGATERANADCEDLFLHLYAEDASLSVSGGRGASAAADWAANKTIALPDWRGRTLAGLDDMGSTAAGVLTTSVNGFGASGGVPTTLGNGGGLEKQVLVTGNLPPYTPAGSVSGTATGTATAILGANTIISIQGAGGGSVLGIGWNSAGTIATPSATVTGTLTGTAQGGLSTAFQVLSPTRLATIYLKL